MNSIEYGAISIDTSIFDGNGLRIEMGLFKKLEQFKPTDIDVVLSDIVYQEVETHLKKKVSDARSSLEKSLKNTNVHLNVDESVVNDAKGLLLANSVDDVTATRLQSFVENTGLLVIDSEDHLDVKLLISAYFQNEPPFAQSGNKKNEFPDAIALLTLEAWAEENDKKIIAVTTDNDWLNYAENSEWIDCTQDFAEALSIFQPQTAPYTFFTSLAKTLFEGSDSPFYSQIEDSATVYTEDLDLDADACSGFFVEQNDMVEVSFNSMEFVSDLSSPNLQLVEVDSEQVVVQARLSIEAGASCSFSLSVHDSIDKDYVFIDGCSATTTVDYETEVLITFSGDFTDSDDFTSVEITDIEFLSSPSSVNFGELEPDFWSD
ncbi:PIN domain-containing protein [Vibrio crassostreae]|uniref:PIN domain-containing protein n=1 Tax=Vibrio crassostreae TaxID=246167 RepID=UPI001B31726D|nr:PIN domain-containing protein [Vibrio crassostreae]